jgi:hypothetical protein
MTVIHGRHLAKGHVFVQYLDYRITFQEQSTISLFRLGDISDRLINRKPHNLV